MIYGKWIARGKNEKQNCFLFSWRLFSKNCLLKNPVRNARLIGEMKAFIRFLDFEKTFGHYQLRFSMVVINFWGTVQFENWQRTMWKRNSTKAKFWVQTAQSGTTQDNITVNAHNAIGMCIKKNKTRLIKCRRWKWQEDSIG